MTLESFTGVPDSQLGGELPLPAHRKAPLIHNDGGRAGGPARAGRGAITICVRKAGMAAA